LCIHQAPRTACLHHVLCTDSPSLERSCCTQAPRTACLHHVLCIDSSILQRPGTPKLLAPLASTMCNATACRALCALVTVQLLAPLASTMCFTPTRRALSALVALRFLAPLASTIYNAATRRAMRSCCACALHDFRGGTVCDVGAESFASFPCQTAFSKRVGPTLPLFF
jgi:hypothetical protein